MKVSVEFILRIIGMIFIGVIAGIWGFSLGGDNFAESIRYTAIIGLLGALTGLVLTPYVTTRPARAVRMRLGRLSAETLFAGLLGMIVGLLTAALLAFPLSLLPRPFGQIMPLVGVIAFTWLGISLFVMRQGDIMGLLSTLSGRGGESGSSSSWTNLNRTILLDTSVIIDGRVADIARTGFLPGTLFIPRFVLNELQYIADSPDGLRRQRGRRGMEVLAELQKLPNILVRISDINAEGVREVDDKLVVLAKQLKCPILTNDYNLNKHRRTARRDDPQHQRTGKRGQVCCFARRTHDLEHLPGRQGTRSGRGLHGRRHDGGGGERSRLHRRIQGSGRHQSPPNCGGSHDLRAGGRR
jgi:uncharacterized protein YacL